MFWLQQSAELWHYPTFLLYPLLLIACIECFAGYHAWRFLLGLNGAILGFTVGAILCVMTGAAMFVLIGALLGATLGAILFAGVVPVGSAVFAFTTVASFAIVVGRVVGFPPAGYLPAALAAGIAAAVGVLTVRRPVMITLAAIAGAQQIAVAWSAYYLPADAIPLPNTLIPSEWLLFSALAAMGLVMQFATSRNPPPSQPHMP